MLAIKFFHKIIKLDGATANSVAQILIVTKCVALTLPAQKKLREVIHLKTADKNPVHSKTSPIHACTYLHILHQISICGNLSFSYDASNKYLSQQSNR